MGFNDWINIAPAPMSALDRNEEVDSVAKDELAREMQSRLRGTIDHGIDLRSARRANSVRVQSEGGRLVIDTRDPAEVLGDRGGRRVQQPVSQGTAAGVEALFDMGNGVPKVVTGADGNDQLAFRTLRADQLFARQSEEEQDRQVEQTVSDTIRMGLVNAYEGAVREVRNRNPESK